MPSDVTRLKAERAELQALLDLIPSDQVIDRGTVQARLNDVVRTLERLSPDRAKVPLQQRWPVGAYLKWAFRETTLQFGMGFFALMLHAITLLLHSLPEFNMEENWRSGMIYIVFALTLLATFLGFNTSRSPIEDLLLRVPDPKQSIQHLFGVSGRAEFVRITTSARSGLRKYILCMRTLLVIWTLLYAGEGLRRSFLGDVHWPLYDCLVLVLQNSCNVLLFAGYQHLARPEISSESVRRKRSLTSLFAAGVCGLVLLDCCFTLGVFSVARWHSVVLLLEGLVGTVIVSMWVGRMDNRTQRPPAALVGGLYLFAATQILAPFLWRPGSPSSFFGSAPSPSSVTVLEIAFTVCFAFGLIGLLLMYFLVFYSGSTGRLFTYFVQSCILETQGKVSAKGMGALLSEPEPGVWVAATERIIALKRARSEQMSNEERAELDVRLGEQYLRVFNYHDAKQAFQRALTSAGANAEVRRKLLDLEARVSFASMPL